MLLSLKNSLFIVFLALEKGSTLTKLKASFLCSFLFSPMTFFFARIRPFLVPDLDFAFIIIIAIIIDWLTGMVKWWKREQFDYRKMILGLIEKVAISFLAMILFNGLSNIKELVQHPDLCSYFSLVGKLAIFFYVAGSCFNNMFYITGGKFPPIGFMKKMKNFEQTADLSKFTQEENKPVDHQP